MEIQADALVRWGLKLDIWDIVMVGGSRRIAVTRGRPLVGRSAAIADLQKIKRLSPNLTFAPIARWAVDGRGLYANENTQ